MKIAVIVMAIAFSLFVAGCGSPATYEGKVDAVIYEYGASQVFFHDGSTVIFQEKLDFVIGDEYRLVVQDKHLKSFIHLDK